VPRCERYEGSVDWIDKYKKIGFVPIEEPNEVNEERHESIPASEEEEHRESVPVYEEEEHRESVPVYEEHRESVPVCEEDRHVDTKKTI